MTSSQQPFLFFIKSAYNLGINAFYAMAQYKYHSNLSIRKPCVGISLYPRGTDFKYGFSGFSFILVAVCLMFQFIRPSLIAHGFSRNVFGGEDKDINECLATTFWPICRECRDMSPICPGIWRSQGHKMKTCHNMSQDFCN